LEKPKPQPFTVDPVKDAFRKMQTPGPTRVIRHRPPKVETPPFSEDGISPSSSKGNKSPEPLGGHSRQTTRRRTEFFEEGLQEADRLQRRRRRP
jgi:hypothetical protein